MFKLLAKVQEMERLGHSIVHFEIGDPDFATPQNITEAACRSLRNGETHYTNSMGLMDMRLEVARTTELSRGFKPDVSQILITPGANIVIYYAILCLVNAGEEVIVPNPGFPTYYSAIRLCDVLPAEVPLREANEFRMNPDDVAAKITDKTRLIIINSPQNPTGAVMTREELDSIFDLAKRHDIYLLCDEVYSRMIYDETYKFYSPSTRDGCKTHTILTNGFSKAFAMTGWRIGAVIGPENVIEKMGLLLQTTSSCVSPFIQRAAIEAINGPQEEVRRMMQEYRQRRDLLVNGLNKLPGVRCLFPGGAFYTFANIKETGMDDVTFAERALKEAGVALLPGSSFGAGGSGFVRLCYAVSMENITEGLNRLRRLLRG